MDALSYPETNNYRAGCIVSKSRKLASGEHEAVAAFFFDGKRKNQFFAIRETRAAAIRAAEYASKTGGKEPGVGRRDAGRALYRARCVPLERNPFYDNVQWTK